MWKNNVHRQSQQSSNFVTENNKYVSEFLKTPLVTKVPPLVMENQSELSIGRYTGKTVKLYLSADGMG